MIASTPFTKPTRKECNLLMAELRQFLIHWKLSEDKTDIANQWLFWAACYPIIGKHRLDWLGYCILVGFSDHSGTRGEIRTAAIRAAKRALE